jgi:hypothetical protein
MLKTNKENLNEIWESYPEWSLVYRLMKRASIRRSITSRKSVQEGKPDRISDLLEEAALEIYQKELDIKLLTNKLSTRNKE